jgi:hypothetical protein
LRINAAKAHFVAFVAFAKAWINMQCFDVFYVHDNAP